MALFDDSAKRASKSRNIALVCIHYPPLCTSAAVQMRDLAVELCTRGHFTVVFIPTVGLHAHWATETVDGVHLLRIRVPEINDVNYIRRTLSELLLPFLMILRFRRSPFVKVNWDIVAWYSPTIFFGLLVWYLRRTSGCRTYLILRDIFPDWTLDLGLMRKGLVYAFFKSVAYIQYSAADVIGVQSESNLAYLDSWRRSAKRVEVLPNWQTPGLNVGSTIDIASTPLVGRKIAVYIGNMGVAQGMDVLLDLAKSLLKCKDIGFLFVGRGSEISRMKDIAKFDSLSNTMFFDEIDSSEIPGLLSQCYVGLLALDPRHKTHNIPGKLLSYLVAGLPVVARVNHGTDVMSLINEHYVGKAFDSASPEPLKRFITHLIGNPWMYQTMSNNGRILARTMFSSSNAAGQIIGSFENRRH